MLSSNDQRRSCHEMPAYISPLHTWQLWAELVPDSAPGLSPPVIAIMCSMSVWTALALAVYNKNQDCTGITEEHCEPSPISHGSNPNVDDLSVQSHFIYSKVGQGLSGMGKICLGCRSVKRKDVNVVVGYIWFWWFFFGSFHEWSKKATKVNTSDISGWVILMSFQFAADSEFLNYSLNLGKKNRKTGMHDYLWLLSPQHPI